MQSASWKSLAWLLCVGCVQRPAPAVDEGTTLANCNEGVEASTDVVLTERGPVRGVASPSGRAFKGIPFARPPVGEGRWRAPVEDMSCFEGVKDGTPFGPMCPHIQQEQGKAFDASAPVVGSEDCLSLNVFTPSDAAPGSQLPVLFFIHGGGNTVGSSSTEVGSGISLFDGTQLAQRGRVVVVTTQYRLGALGFLALPLETDGSVSGNYGLLDQQAALKWVQRNIAAFGGDASRVLLFGESAGAVDTCMHLAMKGSAGLFHRAILQSGSCAAAAPLSQRRTEAAKWLSGTGCEGHNDVAACLRRLTPEALIRAFPVEVVVGARRGDVSWGPTVDGVVLPEGPLDAMLNGRHHPVPILVGSNTEETSLSTPLISTEAEYRQALSALVGPSRVEEVVTRYPIATYGTPRKALIQVTTDAFFGCQARLIARAASLSKAAPTYRYLFARAPTLLGAYHGLELVYVFQKVEALTATPKAQDLAVQEAMMQSWTNFAYTGALLPTQALPWSEYASSEPLLQIDAVSSQVSGWRNSECDFWDSLLSKAPPPPP